MKFSSSVKVFILAFALAIFAATSTVAAQSASPSPATSPSPSPSPSPSATPQASPSPQATASASPTTGGDKDKVLGASTKLGDTGVEIEYLKWFLAFVSGAIVLLICLRVIRGNEQE